MKNLFYSVLLVGSSAFAQRECPQLSGVYAPPKGMESRGDLEISQDLTCTYFIMKSAGRTETLIISGARQATNDDPVIVTSDKESVTIELIPLKPEEQIVKKRTTEHNVEFSSAKMKFSLNPNRDLLINFVAYDPQGRKVDGYKHLAKRKR